MLQSSHALLALNQVKQIITVCVDEMICFDRLGILKVSVLLRDIEDVYDSVLRKSKSLFNTFDDEEKKINRLSHEK